MDYHVARNNQKLGVYPEADIRTRLQTGEILSSDLVWCEGMSGWRPASEVFGVAPPPVAPPSIPPTPAGYPNPGFSAVPLSPKPGNCLVWAILVTLLCCLPLGIVSMMCGRRVDWE